MFKRFSAGFAVGYVFGAQAGQKRYDQITDLAQRAMDLPVVSNAASTASEWWSPERRQNLLKAVGERVGLHHFDDVEDEDKDIAD